MKKQWVLHLKFRYNTGKNVLMNIRTISMANWLEVLQVLSLILKLTNLKNLLIIVFFQEIWQMLRQHSKNQVLHNKLSFWESTNWIKLSLKKQWFNVTNLSIISNKGLQSQYISLVQMIKIFLLSLTCKPRKNSYSVSLYFPHRFIYLLTTQEGQFKNWFYRTTTNMHLCLPINLIKIV